MNDSTDSLIDIIAYMRNHIDRLRSRSLLLDDNPLKHGESDWVRTREGFLKWLETCDNRQNAIQRFHAWTEEYLTEAEIARIAAALRKRRWRRVGKKTREVSLSPEAYKILKAFSEADGISVSEVIARELGRSRRYLAIMEEKGKK